jgi:hypothetical protein
MYGHLESCRAHQWHAHDEASVDGNREFCMAIASHSSGDLPFCIIPYVGGLIPGQKAAARSRCGCYLRNRILSAILLTKGNTSIEI